MARAASLERLGRVATAAGRVLDAALVDYMVPIWVLMSLPVFGVDSHHAARRIAGVEYLSERYVIFMASIDIFGRMFTLYTLFLWIVFEVTSGPAYMRQSLNALVLSNSIIGSVFLTYDVFGGVGCWVALCGGYPFELILFDVISHWIPAAAVWRSRGKITVLPARGGEAREHPVNHFHRLSGSLVFMGCYGALYLNWVNPSEVYGCSVGDNAPALVCAATLLSVLCLCVLTYAKPLPEA